MTHLLNRLRHYFLPNAAPLTGRPLQLRLDTATLFALIPPLSPRHRRRRAQSRALVQDVEDSHHENNLDASIFKQQALRLRSHLFSRSLKLLSHAHESTEAVHQHLGFHTDIAPSSVPNAGLGVFVRGAVEPGDVVSLYPGVSYLPSQARNAASSAKQQEDEMSIQLGGDYCIGRYDGVILNGFPNVVSQVLNLTSTPDNPFANGHIINHPPKPPAGISDAPGANALQFMVDVDLSTLKPSLADRVPVMSCAHPVSYMERLENLAIRQRVKGVECFLASAGSNENVRRMVAIVALRRVENEELFIDYRFHPKVDKPEWYWHCDEGATSRRWNYDKGGTMGVAAASAERASKRKMDVA